MDTNITSYQVVFLVDENSKDPSTRESERYVNTVRSAVLKLLTHFSSVVHEESKQLQWGFKFFESHSNKRRPIQKYVFKEFNHRTFEEFENELEFRLPVANPKDVNPYESSSNVKLSQDPLEGDPLESLTSAFREITFEYPWDRPDILSPVKPVRRSKQRQTRKSITSIPEDYNGKHNLLFVFSSCPVSSADVKRFADCDNSKEFLESIIPKQLYLHFSHQNKIRLFWMLDERRPLFNSHSEKVGNSQESDDYNGIYIIDKALAHLGGCVVPIASIVNSEFSSLSICAKNQSIAKDHVQDVDASANKSNHYCDIPLPVSTSLDHYINHLKAPNDVQSSVAKLVLPGSGRKSTCIELDVGIVPFKSNLNDSIDRQSQQSPRPQSSQVPAVLKRAPDSERDNSISSSEIGFTIQKHGNAKKEGGIVYEVQVAALGIIERRQLRLTLCDPMESYLMTENGGNPEQYQDILSNLESRALALVVDVRRSGYPVRLGILKPLTSGTGCFSLVKSSLETQLQKQLIFTHTTENGDGSAVKTFAENCCKRFIDSSLVNPPTAGAVDTSSPGCTNSGLPLSSSVEAWCSSEVQSTSVGKLISFLKNSCSSEDKVSSVLAKLQQAYIDRRNKRLYSTSNVTGGPNTSNADTVLASPTRSKGGGKKRKLSYTPGKGKRRQAASPRKRARLTSLRRSPRKAVRNKYGAAAAVRKRLMPGNKQRTSSAPTTRRDLIMEKVKIAKQQKETAEAEREKELSAEERLAVSQTDINFLESTTEEDLIANARNIHDKWIDGEGSPIVCAKTIVRSFVQFASRQTDSESERKALAVQLLDAVVSSSKAIREKYASKDDETSKECRFREFQIQTHLHMEMWADCLLDDTEEILEQKASEVSMMLRGISFIRDNSFLVSFMQTSLLMNYVRTCPKLLCKIYEEMMQPIPPPLQHLCEDSDSGDTDTESQACPSMLPPSVSSVTYEPLSMARSNRGRGLSRYKSFDIPLSRRISIPMQTKKPEREKGERRSVRIASATKSKPAPAIKGNESKKVCRNLLGELAEPKKGKLERRQSVAVMQTSFKTPTKGKEKKDSSRHVLKTKSVAETPAHKQRANRVWRQQEMMRRKSSTVTDVEVIQESPEKAVSSTKKPGLRTSPRKAAGAKLLRRNSFYVNKDEYKSRNVEKYTRLEERMTRPLLSPPWRGGHGLPGPQLCNSTPPRRIKPLAFFNMLDPSPQKPAPATVGSRTSRSLSAIFSQMDSPSKNTRLQIKLKSPEPTAVVRVKTPKKVVTPKRNLIANFKTPTKKETVSPLVTNIPDTPTHSTNEQDTISTPKKVNRLGLCEDLILSPDRLTRNQLKLQSQTKQTPPAPVSNLIPLTKKDESGNLSVSAYAEVKPAAATGEAVKTIDTAAENTQYVSSPVKKPVKAARRVSLKAVDVNSSLNVCNDAFRIDSQAIMTKSPPAKENFNRPASTEQQSELPEKLEAADGTGCSPVIKKLERRTSGSQSSSLIDRTALLEKSTAGTSSATGGDTNVVVPTRKRKLSSAYEEEGHAEGTPDKRRRTLRTTSTGFSFMSESSTNIEAFDETAQMGPAQPGVSGDLITEIEEVSNASSIPSIYDEASNMSGYSLRSRPASSIAVELLQKKRGSKLGSSGSGSNFGFAREGSSSMLGFFPSEDNSTSSSFTFDASSPSFSGLQSRLTPADHVVDVEEESAQSPVFTSPTSRRNPPRTSVSSASKYQSPRVQEVRASPATSRRYSPNVTRDSIKHLIESPILELATSSSSGSRGSPRGARTGGHPARGRTRRSLCDSYQN